MSFFPFPFILSFLSFVLSRYLFYILFLRGEGGVIGRGCEMRGILEMRANHDNDILAPRLCLDLLNEELKAQIEAHRGGSFP